MNACTARQQVAGPFGLQLAEGFETLSHSHVCSPAPHPGWLKPHALDEFPTQHTPAEAPFGHLVPLHGGAEADGEQFSLASLASVEGASERASSPLSATPPSARTQRLERQTKSLVQRPPERQVAPSVPAVLVAVSPTHAVSRRRANETRRAVPMRAR